MSWVLDRALIDLAKRQAGVASYFQLAQLGFTDSQRGTRMRAGEWIGVLPGIVRMYWSDDTWLQRHWAAALWGGPRALLSCRSAAVLIGLAVAPAEFVELIAPNDKRPAQWLRSTRIPRISVKDFPEAATTCGLPHTSAVSTLMSLGAVMSDEELRKVVVGATRDEIVELRALRQALANRATFRGRSGAASLRRVIASLK